MSKRRMQCVPRARCSSFALVVVAAACGGGSHKTAASRSRCRRRRPRRARRGAASPVAPLTGLPDPKDVARKRLGGHGEDQQHRARAKQYGVDQADVVYEEVVEGGITRLAAIFNSQAPDRVGPVRSVRKTDQSIVWPIGGIFAYSGGAQYAIDEHRHRAREAARRDAGRADDVPRSRQLALRAVQPLGARRPDVQGRRQAGPAAAAVRRTASRARRSAGRPAAAVSVGFAAGFDAYVDVGREERHVAADRRRVRRRPTSTPRTCRSRRRTSS